MDSNGESYDIERFSGGEEDLANLSLRIAISKILAERSGASFNLIILDEVFGSQDTARRRNIIKVLTHLSRQFRQILLITHIEDMKHDYLTSLLEVREAADGASNIRVLD